MAKRTLFFLTWFLTFLVVIAFSQEQQEIAARVSVIDTSLKPASVQLVSGSIPAIDSAINIVSAPDINDPKKGFKNLFEESPVSVNGSRLNPKAVSFVQDYIKSHGKKMEEIKEWGQPYFNMIDMILTQHNVPKELKYLAVIESHLKVTARSWAGAVGPWQFMPATARGMGLRVDRYVDERMDYFKSTHAAANYLNYLYSLYGDWLLVIAAYNGGPGNVNKAIRRSGSKDFWALQYSLPTESRNHVKKFIATHYIMEGQGSVATLTKSETKQLNIDAKNTNIDFLSDEEKAGLEQLELSGKYNSVVIAKHIVYEINQFNRLNPEFDNLLSLNGSYTMRLPQDKMELFKAKKMNILNESIQILIDALNSPVSTKATSSKL